MILDRFCAKLKRVESIEEVRCKVPMTSGDIRNLSAPHPRFLPLPALEELNSRLSPQALANTFGINGPGIGFDADLHGNLSDPLGLQRLIESYSPQVKLHAHVTTFHRFSSPRTKAGPFFPSTPICGHGLDQTARLKDRLMSCGGRRSAKSSPEDGSSTGNLEKNRLSIPAVRFASLHFVFLSDYQLGQRDIALASLIALSLVIFLHLLVYRRS